jgi:hypothetical protein
MYLIQEALARERIREREQLSRNARQTMDLAAANRWHYLAERARVAARRRAVRARAVARAYAGSR